MRQDGLQWVAPMGRSLLRVAAWAAATTIGMAVSWFGVHSVLATGALEAAPQAIPVAPPVSTVPGTPELVPPTSNPRATTPSSSPSSSSRSSTSAPPPSSSSAPAGDVRSYQLTGGRVALELGPASARLVSATPAPGWQMQTWSADGWLRVDFSRPGSNTSSLFATWNGHPPTVQTT
jgi:hypothetical protein